MTGPDKSAQRDSLGKRIDAAKEKRQRRLGGKQTQTSSGLGLGLRIAAELVASIAVSVGIGIGLDTWLGTTPWLLILFFILGAAAGFRNTVRVAQNYDEARKRERESQEHAAESRAGDGEKDGG